MLVSQNMLTLAGVGNVIKMTDGSLLGLHSESESLWETNAVLWSVSCPWLCWKEGRAV